MTRIYINMTKQHIYKQVMIGNNINFVKWKIKQNYQEWQFATNHERNS